MKCTLAVLVFELFLKSLHVNLIFAFHTNHRQSFDDVCTISLYGQNIHKIPSPKKFQSHFKLSIRQNTAWLDIYF